jgi:hypothetical protein
MNVWGWGFTILSELCHQVFDLEFVEQTPGLTHQRLLFLLLLRYGDNSG